MSHFGLFHQFFSKIPQAGIKYLLVKDSQGNLFPVSDVARFPRLELNTCWLRIVEATYSRYLPDTGFLIFPFNRNRSYEIDEILPTRSKLAKTAKLALQKFHNLGQLNYY